MNRSLEDLPFVQVTGCFDLIYILFKYYQNVSKMIKAVECTIFPHLSSFKGND